MVNAAAYTAVDQAESEPDLADAVNWHGAGAAAAAAARLSVPIIHLSTDYVFAGDLDRPYREDDPTGPIGAYGRSKLLGEMAVAAAAPNHAILRTAWIYSPFGTNFVKTMLRLAGTRDILNVVADQCGSPTSAMDIGDAILSVCIATFSSGQTRVCAVCFIWQQRATRRGPASPRPFLRLLLRAGGRAPRSGPSSRQRIRHRLSARQILGSTARSCASCMGLHCRTGASRRRLA